MATPFPITLPADSVLGRLALTAGDAESIPLAQLLAAMTGGTSYIGQILTKRKTADQSQVSNTVLANDNDLTFPIAANEEWCGFICVAFGTNPPAHGLKSALNAPSGAVIQFDANIVTDSPGVTMAGSTTTIGAAITMSTSQLGLSNKGALTYRFWVLNGGTPGNVTLQWAQNTSTTSPATFPKGSFMQITRVG